MAQPTTEVNEFRMRIRHVTESLRNIDDVLALVEDHGVTDAERQAFFASVFTPDYDVTWAEFAAGVVALRAVRTARDANKLAVAKLLI